MDTVEIRRQMVQQQIRTWDVFEPTVLQLMSDLPREDFLPPEYRHVAYSESEIPIGHGQKTMAPLLEGRLLQELAPRGKDSILEIGTGSGYLTACLAKLSASVTSVDIYEDFVDAAAERLEQLSIDNVFLHTMDATRTLPNDEFDAIAVTGSVPLPQESFLNVLKPGGRMFVVVGESPVMRAQLVTRGDGGEWLADSLFETELAPLVNATATPAFSF